MKKFPLFALSVLAGSTLTLAQAQITAIRPQPQKPAAQSVKATTPKLHAPIPTSGGTSSLIGGSDSCTTPDIISGMGPHAFDNTAATTGTQGQAESICNFAGQIGIANDVWYSWTAGSTGNTTLSLCGQATNDSKVAVYNGSGCPSGAAIACNDDSCGLQTQLVFLATGGNTYTIQLGSYPGGTTGTGSFTLTTAGPPTGQDDCSLPVVISGPGPHAFDNTSATTGTQGQTESACNFFGQTGISSDIWYTWTAGATGIATLTLCGMAGNDSKVAVYNGSGCPTGSAIACNDDSCGLQSQLIFCPTAANTYTIQLGSYPGGTTGTGSFTINVTGPGAGSDDCATPIAISGPGPHAFDNTLATTGCEGQSESACLAFGTTGIANDIWYTWTSGISGAVEFTLLGGTGIDSKVAIYSGSGCPVTAALGCDDDSCGTLQSTVDFTAVNGQTYTIQLGNYPGAAAGTGTFTIMPVTPPTGCIYDDGSTENSIGLTNGGELMWLHRFGTLSSPSSLTTVSTAWGTAAFPGGAPANGTAAFVTVYSDPNQDGDPTDGVLLAKIPTTVQNVDTDMLNATPLGSTISVNGYYFVGASVVHPAGQFPAPLDTSACIASPVAWIVGDTTGALNYTSLGANNVPPANTTAIGFPGVWLLRADCNAEAGMGYCSPGDGTVTTACPCANIGTLGNGCANSVNAAGAHLTSTGATNPDTVALVASGMPATVTSIFLKGNANIAAGTPFGDGVRCAGGTLVRLGQELNSGGMATYPSGVQQSISVKGGTPPGSGITAFYQTYYRNAAAAFCPPATFNVTNGYKITW